MLCVITMGCARSDEGEKQGGYREEVETWIEGREERLGRPDGYLSIVGLFWLRDGENTFGSDPSSDLVFPDKAPASIGRFDVVDGQVMVTVDPTAGVTHNGTAVRALALSDDRGADGPTILEMGTLTWYVIKRGDRLLIRLRDSESKLRKSFAGLKRFAIDEKWRFEGTLETYTPDKYIPFDDTIGLVTNHRVYGTIVVEIDGETYRLDALGDQGAKKLFVIFADATSGLETYGGGRYVYVDTPGDDGVVVIDFNKAYNPPCAFNSHTTCLLPPPQNRLAIRVTAGEKRYEKHPK
jgi:uncharacterized protein (DUF1684 family)